MQRKLILALFICLNGTWACAAENGADQAAVNSVLDSLHHAAATADREGYLGLFTKDGVFMGTDDWERWPMPKLAPYVAARFKGGVGWTYRSVERHVSFTSDGNTAWFDEITVSERWGRFRGTGVLVKQSGNWQIAHYAMSFLVPNEAWEKISAVAVEAFAERKKTLEPATSK